VAQVVDVLPGCALPDSVLGYHGVDVVVIRDMGAAELEPKQAEALRSWVYLGVPSFSPRPRGGARSTAPPSPASWPGALSSSPF